MKAEFQRWYEAVQLALDPHAMEARWAAVQALARSVNDAELDALARAAFRSDQTTVATSAVRTKLADKGGAMPDEEFALLAAVTLTVILQQGEPAAARAATMIGTAHFKGLRKVRQPMDLVGLAADARLALARTTRRRPSLELGPMPSLEVDTTQAEETEGSDERISLLAEAFTGVVQQLAERQAAFEQRALHYVSMQAEELDMLWWLQGGRTQAGQLFSEVSREQQPFVLARDLAEVTFALPGASAIGSLLERAGIEDSEPMEIANAIQALPIEWLKTALPDADKHKASPVTTPLHEGIRRRLEVRGESTWIAGWAGVCDIDSAARLTPLQLADLCYCEQLLLHK
ncbi:GTPase-associated system all-helical protein GASH [Pelomonas sp. APW6]|uniref:GTPase-associated system all-helical protein GASH n=1 Tax=Roseateles subflavus TaxID=3053353 RepID=A0ABT7LQA9_9BURK|nr:GTPase-associated system all-helical protein GASH [Pelomonas sp. APW6]MDL5034330.1 GTPase-associated system all-helical protein GASH [Pelomonas sp. APW6]